MTAYSTVHPWKRAAPGADPTSSSTSPSHAAARLFELTVCDLDAVMAGAVPVPERINARSLGRLFERLFDARPQETARILGVTAARLRLDPSVDAAMLDRALNAVEACQRACAVLGREGARRWLRRPQPRLGGRPPLLLLGSAHGTKRLLALLQQEDRPRYTLAG